MMIALLLPIAVPILEQYFTVLKNALLLANKNFVPESVTSQARGRAAIRKCDGLNFTFVTFLEKNKTTQKVGYFLDGLV